MRVNFCAILAPTLCGFCFSVYVLSVCAAFLCFSYTFVFDALKKIALYLYEKLCKCDETVDGTKHIPKFQREKSLYV